MKLDIKDVIINPGCNYPIQINDSSKQFARDIFAIQLQNIAISRLDGRKSHQNILMTVNLLPKFPNLKYVSIGDGDERKNLEN